MSGSVAACQFEPVVGDVEANLETIETVARSLPTSVDLAAFPELCLTGYHPETAAELAEPLPGERIDTVREIARSTNSWLVVGTPERDGGTVYNSTVVVSPDGLEANYRKRKLWGNEAEQFACGDRPAIVAHPAGRIGLLCCYDLNFPELAVEYAQHNCDLLVVTAAWRSGFLDDWRLMTRARARDSVAYVVGSNHTGEQRGREHVGHSLIAGPDGAIHAEAVQGDTEVTVTVEAALIEQERERNPVHESRD